MSSLSYLSMKRFLFIPSCALLAMGMLSSCQKEEMSALELTQELTKELQTVTDYKSAEAAAPRVEVLNKRLQDATVRTVTLNTNALQRSNKEGNCSEYASATVELAREIGRVRASIPVLSHDGDVDREQLVLATGVASGVAVTSPESARKEAGDKYMEHYLNKDHENPPQFEDYYGSAKLREAMAYVADPAQAPIMKFDSEEDVPAIPARGAVSDDAEEETPADDSADDSADETPADDSSDDSSDEPATDDTPADDDSSSDDDGGLDISLDDTASDDSGDSSDDSGDDSSSDDSGDDMDLDLDIDI